jgi:hypothetical protein
LLRATGVVMFLDEGERGAGGVHPAESDHRASRRRVSPRIVQNSLT